MTTTSARPATYGTITSTCWPFESNELTPRQSGRMQEFREDIERARRNNAEGYGFHIWIDGRLHDSAVTWADAFDEARAQRKAGCQDQIVIGSGGSYNVTNDGKVIDGRSVRVALPA